MKHILDLNYGMKKKNSKPYVLQTELTNKYKENCNFINNNINYFI